MDECPTCYRKFEDFRDFSRVYICGTELIEAELVPDSVIKELPLGRTNHAPQIRDVLQNDPWIQQYRRALDDLVGKEVSSRDLLPKWGEPGEPVQPDGVFHLVPGTYGWYMKEGKVKVSRGAQKLMEALYLSVHDGHEPKKKKSHRLAKITFSRIFGEGFIHLLDIGHIEYEGLLRQRE